MTVTEMIRHLETLPEDAEIMVATHGNGYRSAIGPVQRSVVAMGREPGRWWPSAYRGFGAYVVIVIE